jgi:hypothetical protein
MLCRYFVQAGTQTGRPQSVVSTPLSLHFDAVVVGNDRHLCWSMSVECDLCPNTAMDTVGSSRAYPSPSLSRALVSRMRPAHRLRWEPLEPPLASPTVSIACQLAFRCTYFRYPSLHLVIWSLAEAERRFRGRVGGGPEGCSSEYQHCCRLQPVRR